jgi:hypothetical protein
MSNEGEKKSTLNPHKDDDTKSAPIGMGPQYKILAIVSYAYGAPIHFD